MRFLFMYLIEFDASSARFVIQWGQGLDILDKIQQQWLLKYFCKLRTIVCVATCAV